MSKDRDYVDRLISASIKYGGLDKAAAAYMGKGKKVLLVDIKKIEDEAINLRIAGKYEQAIERCDEACNLAIQAKPPYLDAFNTMAGIYITAGKFKEAIEYCDIAIEINPAYVYIYCNKAVALRKIGNYKAALECCNTAIRLDETYLDAYNEKAKILTETREFKEAIECCESAIKIDSTYSPINATKDLALKKLADHLKKIEQEQIREALEFSKKQAEELEQLKLAEKLSKESFEKSQREEILDFLSRSQDVSDEAAFPAMDIVKRWESTNTELIERLRSFEDPVLNSFLDGEVGIAGGDSSF